MPYIDFQHEIRNTGPIPALKLKGAIETLGGGSQLNLPVFGATIPVDLSQGTSVLIIATANTNITINAPTNVPNVAGLTIGIMIKNEVGGSMGTVTLAAAYKVTATAPFATPPANGMNRWVQFQNTGTTAVPIWTEIVAGANDVAN